MGEKMEGKKGFDVIYEHSLTASRIFHPVSTLRGEDLVAGADGRVEGREDRGG